MRLRFCALVAVLWLMLAGSAVPAQAHGYIIRAIPEDRAVLDRAPARAQYWFSEALEPRFSSISVRDSAGAVIASGAPDEDRPTLLEARLPPNLPDGAYVSELRIAFASDGHVITENRAFFVGEAGEIAAGINTGDPVVLEIVWRFLLTGGLLLLTGTLALYALVLVPAWGNPSHHAGLLPPRVMRRIHAVMLGALVIAALGQLVALVQQTMLFFNADPGRVFAEGLINVVRFSTRFGDVWNMRLIVLVVTSALLAAAVWFRDRDPALVRPFWSAAAWSSALALGTTSLASHAAGSLTLPWAAVFSDWLHLAAIALWLGGLAAFSLILPTALAPYAGDARRAALLAALNRFSPVAIVGLLLVIVSGAYSASNWVSAPQDIGSRYGLTLAIKVMLVGTLIAIAGLHHVALRPARYARFQALASRFGARTGSLRLEAVLGAVVLGAAAFLSATPVPEPEITGASLPAPTGTARVAGYDVSVTISPGGPGVNTVDVQAFRDGAPVVEAPEVQLVHPAQDRRSAWLPADPLEPGVFSSVSPDIDIPGTWLLLVDMPADDGRVLRAAFPADIRAEAAVIQARPPGVLQIGLLMALVCAVGYALWPLTRAGLRRLDKGAVPVTIGVLAVLAGIVVIVLGVVVSQNAASQFAALTRPLPEQVNPVVPDQGSLERGEMLFAGCAWPEAAVIELTRRLSRTSDDDLFAIVRDGRGELPACPARTDAERWDLVNFIRSLENR
jgi:copper transport protein